MNVTGKFVGVLASKKKEETYVEVVLPDVVITQMGCWQKFGAALGMTAGVDLEKVKLLKEAAG